MTRREMLMERYEDALFALMMDEMAEARGQAALEENHRLKESGQPEIPDRARRRCHAAIDRGVTERRLRRTGKGFARIVTRVAVVALVAMLLFTTAFAASEDFRVKTLNMVMEVFEDRMEIHFPSASQSADGFVPDLQITDSQLPEGFQLTKEGGGEMGHWYEYRDGDDGAIYTDVMNMENAGMILDTEDVVRSTVTVQGKTAILLEDGHLRQLLWQVGGVWFCHIITENLSTDTLLRYAESIVFE